MTAEPIIGRVDRDARLIRADAALARLQERAGGSVPGVIIVPQLSVAVTSALRFGAPVMRRVYAGEADFDLHFWVHIRPDDKGADLTITGWSEDAKRLPGTAEGEPFPLDAPGWRFECDADLAILGLWAEGAAARIRTRDWIGKAIDSLFVPVDPAIDGKIAELLAAGQSLVDLPVDALIDGISARAELSARPRLANDGSLLGLVGTLKLIRPERDEGANEAPYLPGNWGALDRRMDEALRLPIGRIIANAETIARKLDGPVADDYASYAGDIASAGKHLLGLIDDLADLQAIERDDFDVARERVDLTKVAIQAAGLLTMRANEKAMRVRVETGPTAVVAIGEVRRVLQILINFIGNAVRYAPENSDIVVTAQGDRSTGDVSVTVSDQGPGIAEEDRARIFEKFERLGRRDHGGSGLGLYISNRLARAMSGSIDIASEPGAGAAFTLTLPKWPD
ncbi:MAG: HAMP domain-containing histidine kinase [Sphingomonadales bacterium]|nr:HAMP domain-containing histidine kinase [Sphingomonadales bacterium]